MYELADKIRRARFRLLKMHFDANVGHIGGNLSCLDALLTVYHSFPRPDLVLSKGHAAGALYVALNSAQKLSDSELETFYKNGTKLPAHPAPGGYPAIPFGTGSLGHGLSLAAGLALAKKLAGRGDEFTFCLTSDGEWQEGSTWEALIFAHHHKLSGLRVLVDENRLQGFGSTADVASMEGLAERIRGFGCSVVQVDGHRPDEILKAIRSPSDGPLFIVMQTVKGKGVSFMENKMEWHYLPMSEAQYRQACVELEQL